MTTTLEPPRRLRPTSRRAPDPRPDAAFMAQRTLETHGQFALPLLESGLTVLDAGCGAGTITHGLAEAVLPGRVTGIDLDPAQITRATRLAEGLETVNARFTTASATELPFPANSFDLVFAHALMEHLPDPARALAEFRRVLRPGGLVALCSPDWDQFELRAATPAARQAITAYRAQQTRRGGNPRAGALLPEWLTAAGFGVLSHGQRFETYETTARIAEYLAQHLDAAGDPYPADALRTWARQPDAELRACWKHTVAIRWNR